jgi:putative membrane protein
MFILALLILNPLTVYAHGNESSSPDRLLSTWTWTLVALLGLALFVSFYSFGIQRLWQNAGVGRGVRMWQTVMFAGGIIALFVALFSPLDALSDSLFAAHMGQHMLLMFVAAPLLVMSALPVALLWALPRTWARNIGRWWGKADGLQAGWQFITKPLVALIIFTFALWFWHVPALYDAALHDETIHIIEHITFFVAAALYWWSIFQINRQGISIIYLFGALLESGALGALLTFSQRPWYDGHTTAEWTLSPLDDQQLGGVIMWVPGHLLFMGIIIVVAYRWLTQLERVSSTNREVQG